MCLRLYVLVVGLSEPCSWESSIKIPAQWQRFMAYLRAIPARLDRMPVGVSRAWDDECQFEYTCGVEVARFGEIPSELVRLEIPPQTYAVFQHRGHISAAPDAYFTIWNKALPELGRTVADAPIIERHNPTFDPRTGEGGVCPVGSVGRLTALRGKAPVAFEARCVEVASSTPRPYLPVANLLCSGTRPARGSAPQR